MVREAKSLYILKDTEIIPVRNFIERKVFVTSPEDNTSPSTNYSSEFGGLELHPYEVQRSQTMYGSMIYDPSHSLHVISGIAREREFGSEDYELLLQLDEAHKSTSDSLGLEDYIINSFKFWKVTKKSKTDTEGSNNGEKDESHKCSICLHDHKPGQIVRELPCGHVFHKGCIDKWLKSDTRCPLDNKNIKDLLKNKES